jgi:hypothetical protein
VASFNPESYGPVFAPLVAVDRRRPLGPGTPNRAALAELNRLEIDEAFAHIGPGSSPQIADRAMASCCLAGICLLHDYLDKSHSYSQRFETPTANFWHAIMHRREGDFGNSKYWFHRVGDHPIFESLAQRSAELAAARGEERALNKLTAGGTWNASGFVDLCESALNEPSAMHELCLDVQQAEWELLFD